MILKNRGNLIFAGLLAAYFLIGAYTEGAFTDAPVKSAYAAATSPERAPQSASRNVGDIAQPTPTVPSPVAIASTTRTSPVGNVHYPDTPDYVSPAFNPGMTRDEQIKALMREDPSSYGYTDADREFLQEHGVTEAQARALEEAMARGN